MNLPQELRYTDEHVWVKIEDSHAVIGITDFAQSELGDIIFVELPAEGSDIRVGDVFGSVESVKTVSELYAPLSGKILAINGELEDTPEHINEAAFEAGWLIKIEITNADEITNLLSAEQYQESIS